MLYVIFNNLKKLSKIKISHIENLLEFFSPVLVLRKKVKTEKKTCFYKYLKFLICKFVNMFNVISCRVMKL